MRSFFTSAHRDMAWQSDASPSVAGEQSAVVDCRELLSARDAVDMAPIPCCTSLVFLPIFDSIPTSCFEDAEPLSDHALNLRCESMKRWPGLACPGEVD